MDEVMRRTASQRSAVSHRKKTRRIRLYNFKTYRKILIQLTVSALILVFILLAKGTDEPFTKSVIQNIDNYLSSSLDWNSIYKVINEWTNNTINFTKLLLNHDTKNLSEAGKKAVEQATASEEAADATAPAKTKTAASSVEGVNTKKILIVPVYSSMNSLDLDAKYIKSNFKLHSPVKGYLSSKFGLRINPITKKEEFHPGLDIAANIGSNIYAAMPGEVLEARRSTTYGNVVKILSGKGVVSVYAHCKKYYVKKGQKISGGQKIAIVGSTGMSLGPHLHFEVWRSKRLVDPTTLFSQYK